ncbi:MAG: hypothetical protein HYY38_07300 [Rhodospirillales bacterium]|nr:hypothetical protein [Rhodospirillales bacterium]MBI2978611.1 hypothetical protein [Rhodospirillales bacterium]
MTEDCLRDRLRRLLAVAALMVGLGACEGITPLTADARVPPTISGLSPFKVPEWAGKRPMAYDGTYEGYLINESFYFFCPTATIYFPLSFEIANGLVRRTDNRAQAAPVDGYINDHGIFVANTSLKAVFGQLFIGAITDDRMRGEWRSGPGRHLCHGRIELVRVVDDQRYCEDRLSGKPYATGTECRGIDRFLTKREFEAMLKTSKKS